MRVLHAYNLHRGGGGSDHATIDTIAALRGHGVDVVEFRRDSRDARLDLRGRVGLFLSGIYARDALRAFRAELHRSRPDIVHVHEVYPLISPWVLRECAAARVPVVMTCYDFRLTCPIATHHFRGSPCHRCVGGREYWCVARNCRHDLAESIAYATRNLLARKFELFERHVDRFVVLSTFSERWLVEHAGLAPARIRRIAPAIRIPEAAVADPAASRLAAFAGRFVPEKGVELFAAACRDLRMPMALAGDAPAHPAIGAGDDATLVLTRDARELASFYRSARVVVVPSLFYETFNIVAAEAMSHGIPVVAARIGALDETVRDGETGLLFAAGDVGDLTGKLRRLRDDDALCRRLGDGARRHVAARFTATVHAQALSAVYAELGRGR
jgi:glycosyltransferase involved in cell wall biosynthesis